MEIAKDSIVAPTSAIDIDQINSVMSLLGQDIERASVPAARAATTNWISGLPLEIWSLIADQVSAKNEIPKYQKIWDFQRDLNVPK